MEAKLLKIKVILKELSEVSYMPRLSLELRLEGMGPLLDFGLWPYFMPLFHKLFDQSTHPTLKIAHFFEFFNQIQSHISQTKHID